VEGGAAGGAKLATWDSLEAFEMRCENYKTSSKDTSRLFLAH